ncbi:chaperonin 10-like protein [Aspergillus recurvatus]
MLLGEANPSPRYDKPEVHKVTEIPVPTLRENDVLIKVKACGVCGTDLHIHEGEFIAQTLMPTRSGHETVGVVAAVGPKVKGFNIGDRVVSGNSKFCGECFYCRRGDELFCENFQAHGVTMNGGFAEYCAYPAGRVSKIQNLADVDATLLEPASCAAHGLDKIAPKMGSRILAQLLRLDGGCHVVVCAPEGLKMELAKSLGAGDEYIALSRQHPSAQFNKLKADNPYGFDILVEATGNVKILEDSIDYVRRGFGDEIQIIGSFSEAYKFPAAIDYLGSGRVKVSGIANKVYKIEQWEECLEATRNKSAIKAAITFD